MTPASRVNSPMISSCQPKKPTDTASVNTMFIQPMRHTAASARPGSPAPRFCPTSVAAALDMPQAGISVNIITRIAIVAPATASVDTLARMRMRKIQAVIAMIIWPMPPSDVRTIPTSATTCTRRCRVRTRRCSLPRTRIHNCMSTPTPRPRLVAMAAPSTPSAGTGPQPKMRRGSSTILSALATHSTRIAAAASPAPRNTALMTNSSRITALPPSIHCV